MKSRKCICPWPECHEWATHLESVTSHSYLSNFVCLRYKSIIELKKTLAVELDPEKKTKVQSSIEAQLKFRNLVLHHLKAPSAKDLASKDLYVRRLHFPHEYIKNVRYITKPVTRDIALKYGVGMLPRDSRNVACKENNKYFIPPIISKSHMKNVINSLATYENDEISTRASRSANRQCRTIVEEISMHNSDIINPDALESEESLDNNGEGVNNNINHGDTDVKLLDYIYITIRGMAGLPIYAYSMGLHQIAECTVGYDHNAKKHGIQSVTPDPKTVPTTRSESEVTVLDYMYSVDHLMDKLEQIVRPILAQNDLGKVRRSGPYFNSVMMQNEHCVSILTLLSKCHKCTKAIDLQTSPPLFLNFCTSMACDTTFFSFRRCSKQTCHQCIKDTAVIKRKRKRKEECNIDGTTIDSKVNITKLSPNSRAKRLKRANFIRHKLKVELENALKSAKKVELHSDREGDATIISLIEKAGHLSQKHVTKYRDSLICGLSSELLDESNTNNSEKIKEISEFVDDTIQRIVNFKSVIEGKPKQVRFSPREIRMALTMYSISASGYKELKASSLQVMPSVRQIKNWRSKFNIHEGDNPAMYGELGDRFRHLIRKSSDGTLYVSIMVDEMKLKNGIYVNVMTGEVVGFVSDEGDFRSVRDDVLGIINDMDKKECSSGTDKEDPVSNTDEELAAVAYVNQFRLRTSKNQTANIEFFFNDGSLPGDQLLYQLLHVISQLNNINIRVLMICMDAGGNNSRAAALLRHEAKLTDIPWLPENHISFRDPTNINNTTRIAVAHCATHNMKALRNAFLNSSEDPKTSRHFRTKDGHRFTWNKVVIECFLRDRSNQLPSTHLDQSSTYPNAWNKMRVGYALRPFSEKTLSEQFCHLSVEMGCMEKMLFSGEVSENKDIPMMHQKRLGILKDAFSSGSKSGIIITEKLKAQLAGLEYSVYVASIFNERFMNKKCNLTRDNIEAREQEFKKCLDYFANWRKATVSLKKDENHKDWEEYCICQKTYNNLRIQVSGFFTFARNLLKVDETIDYVPFLYANQSSLESHFSQMRARNADTPQGYIAGLTSIETTKTCKTLRMHNNHMYDGGIDDNETLLATSAFEKSVHSTLKVRQETVSKWLEVGSTIRNIRKQNGLFVLDAAYYNSCLPVITTASKRKCWNKISQSFGSIEEKLKVMKINQTFISYLLEHTKLEDYAVASCRSSADSDSWYRCLFTIKDPRTMHLLSTSCRRVVSKVLQLFRETCLVGARSRFASLWYQIYNSFDDGTMLGPDGPFEILPPNLKKSTNGLYIIVESIAKLVVKWLHEKNESKPTSTCTTIMENQTNEDINRKIVGFVGYALSSTIKNFNEKERKAELSDRNKELSEYREIGTFLRSLRLLHKDAILDTDYMTNCYARNNQMYNRGGMALIAKPYFDFAIHLTKLCDTYLSEGNISRRGNNCLKEAYNVILVNIPLRKRWDGSHSAASKKLLKNNQCYDKVYKGIVRKTINARFSFEIGRVRESKFSHYAKAASKETHRADLKHDFAKTKMKSDGEIARKEIKRRQMEVATVGDKDR